MPLGVDHKYRILNCIGIIAVILPLMPLGVDHAIDMALPPASAGDFTFDAVRR